MQPARPISGGIALRTGALVGGISGILVGGGVWIPGVGTYILIVGLLIAIIADLVAGLLAARRTARIATGTLAGMWTASIGTLIAFVLLCLALATTLHSDFMSGFASSGQDPQTAEATAWLGLAIIGVLLFALSFGVGAGMGALGGLIGRSMSPLAQEPYQPAPVYQQPPYPGQQPPYPPSSYPPTQPSYPPPSYGSDPYSNQ